MIKQLKRMKLEADKEIEAFLRFLRVNIDINFKKIFKITLFIGILMFLNLGAKNPLMSESLSINDSIKIKIENNYDTIQYPLIVRNRLHEKLVNEVKTYINEMAPTSKIDPELLVTMCQKYNLNITFVLAQGLLESHFGTKGRATITNSVFNVGAWDSRTINTYRTVNESIEPYMLLLKNEYLINKEISDLIQDRGFKNTYGHRYATSLYYEQSLRTLMVNIDMKTSIKMYQDVMNLSNDQILAFFAPTKKEINKLELQAYNKNDTSERTIQ